MEVHHQAMQIINNNDNNGGAECSGSGFLASCRRRLCSSAPAAAAVDALWRWLVGFAARLGRIARDDPRRVAHSLKVGLALTLVSVFYYVTPLFNGWGPSTLWAVITVVFVMQFTVGGTMSKGLNRSLATLVAGILAVGAHVVAPLAGQKGEPVLLGVFIFLVGAAATFSRFIPEVNARYEYGVTIFILTFSMVALSSYRVEDEAELIKLAHERVTTILVGVATCIVTSIFVFPIWAGEDLHKLAAGNLDKLAEFLEGMHSECFSENAKSEKLEGKAFLRVYKSVLNSKATEDSLRACAKWEPGHGKFRFRHPWSQYQKLGALCRQCAASMEALASYVVMLGRSQVIADDPEQCLRVRAACGTMSLHSARALRELSAAVRAMAMPPPKGDGGDDMSAAARAASDFSAALSADDAALLRVVHVATAASLLADIVAQVRGIAECGGELGGAARALRKPWKKQWECCGDQRGGLMGDRPVIDLIDLDMDGHRCTVVSTCVCGDLLPISLNIVLYYEI